MFTAGRVFDGQRAVDDFGVTEDAVLSTFRFWKSEPPRHVRIRERTATSEEHLAVRWSSRRSEVDVAGWHQLIEVVGNTGILAVEQVLGRTIHHWYEASSFQTICRMSIFAWTVHGTAIDDLNIAGDYLEDYGESARAEALDFLRRS